MSEGFISAVILLVAIVGLYCLGHKTFKGRWPWD